MRLADLNALEEEAAVHEFQRCCGSSRWARRMAEARPFASLEEMGAAADTVWWALGRPDWLEAFAAHPQIGASPAGPSDSGGASASAALNAWSAGEQAGVSGATQRTRQRFVEANRNYQARFGYIFIVCATGKTADEMLDLLETRLLNDPDHELRIAAEEQRKITQLRLAKLLGHTADTP